MTGKKKVLLWLAIVIVVPVGGVWIYAALFWGFVRVPVGNMKNTILPGDKMTFSRVRVDIKRGDVIVFRYPKQPSTMFISRVVGLPGETIEIKDRSVYIDGQELPEQHVAVDWEQDASSLLPLHERSQRGTGGYRVYEYDREGQDPAVLFSGDFGSKAPFAIPAGEYYVMGDNRDNSLDSRFWGTVKRELILGKAGFVYWSSGSDGIRTDRLFTRIK